MKENRHFNGKLSLVIDGQRASFHFEPGDGAEGNGRAIQCGGALGLAEPELARVFGDAEGLGAAEEAELPEAVVGNRLRALAVVSAVDTQGRANVDVLQLRGILPKFGLSFKHDVVLVRLRVQCGNLRYPSA